MASSRKPGVAGSDLVPSEINDGTLCRQTSPLPGSVAGEGGLQTNKPRRFVRNSKAVLLFREGNRGPQITKLQKLLNARLTPSPGLKIDGYFGPLTRAAVLSLQKAASIARDGVVGKATWFQLVSNEEIAVTGVPIPKVSVAPNPKPSARFTRAPLATTPIVLDLSLQAKFIRVIELVPSKLPQELGNTFRTMVSPLNLAIGLGVLAASQYFGVGEILDVVIVATIGATAAKDLLNAIVITIYAGTEAELNEAATYMAQAVIQAGTMALLKAISRTAKSEGGTGGGEAEETGTPQQPSTPEPVKAVSQRARPGRSLEDKHPVPEPTKKAPAEAQTVAGQLEEQELRNIPKPTQRELVLGTDPARGFIQAEGTAGVRLEQTLGRTISRSSDPAVDFKDTILGPISLKGPIPAQGSVEGLANAVVKDAMGGNTATRTVVVDTLGLSKTQISTLKAAIEAGTKGTSKTILYLY